MRSSDCTTTTAVAAAREGIGSIAIPAAGSLILLPLLLLLLQQQLLLLLQLYLRILGSGDMRLSWQCMPGRHIDHSQALLDEPAHHHSRENRGSDVMWSFCITARATTATTTTTTTIMTSGVIPQTNHIT